MGDSVDNYEAFEIKVRQFLAKPRLVQRCLFHAGHFIVFSVLPVIVAIGLALAIYTYWESTPSRVLKSLTTDTQLKDAEAATFTKVGQYGDLFGSVNALFSGMALAGVVVAIFLQSRELALQRKELEETRAQISRSADANLQAAIAMKDQAVIQLRATELNSLSTLIASINSQLSCYDASVSQLSVDSPYALVESRKQYHERIHELLGEIGHSFEVPEGCESRAAKSE